MSAWRLRLMTWGVGLVMVLRPWSPWGADVVAFLLARTTNTRTLLEHLERERAAGRELLPQRAMAATLLYALATDLDELQEERGAAVFAAMAAKGVDSAELLRAVDTLRDWVSLPAARLLQEVWEYLMRFCPAPALPPESVEVLLDRLGLKHLADPPEPANPFDESRRPT